MAVPIFRNGEPIGAIAVLYRQEVRPFSDTEVALVETFADQSAVAIGNANTFNQRREKSREVEEQAAQLSLRDSFHRR